MMNEATARLAPTASDKMGSFQKDERSMKIRPTTPDDIPDLQAVLDATELFPSDMLPDMFKRSLSGDQSADMWLTCEMGGKVVGFCYAAPEDMAEGAWNMLAIAVLPTEQGNGCGGAIARHLEDALRKSGQRILLADTSGTDAFAQTRNFYRKNGYSEEARIRDFWAPGDDKIVFWKALSPA